MTITATAPSSRDRVSTDEVGFSQLHRPAESGRERRNILRDFVSVERITGLEPQAVARTKPGEFQSVRCAGLEQRFSKRDDFGGVDIEFETILARVAGAADVAVKPRDRRLDEVIVFHRAEFRPGE